MSVFKLVFIWEIQEYTLSNGYQHSILIVLEYPLKHSYSVTFSVNVTGWHKNCLKCVKDGAHISRRHGKVKMDGVGKKNSSFHYPRSIVYKIVTLTSFLRYNELVKTSTRLSLRLKAIAGYWINFCTTGQVGYKSFSPWKSYSTPHTSLELLSKYDLNIYDSRKSVLRHALKIYRAGPKAIINANICLCQSLFFFV